MKIIASEVIYSIRRLWNRSWSCNQNSYHPISPL